jgi:hypothetical protein
MWCSTSQAHHHFMSLCPDVRGEEIAGFIGPQSAYIKAPILLTFLQSPPFY